jgi:hypothetical protein
MALIIHSFLPVNLIWPTFPFFSVASFGLEKTGTSFCTPARGNAPDQNNFGPSAAGHPTQYRTDYRAVVTTKIGAFLCFVFSLDGRFYSLRDHLGHPLHS